MLTKTQIKTAKKIIPRHPNFLVQPLLAEYGPRILNARNHILQHEILLDLAQEIAPTFYIHFYPTQPLSPLPILTTSPPPTNQVVSKTISFKPTNEESTVTTIETVLASFNPDNLAKSIPFDIQHTPLTLLLPAEKIHQNDFSTTTPNTQRTHLFLSPRSSPWCSLEKSTCKLCDKFWENFRIPKNASKKR